MIRNEELEKIRGLDGGPVSKGLKAITLPTLFRASAGGAGLRKALEDLRWRVSECIAEGYNIIILSDRGHDAEDAPIPSLLAVSAVQHHLIRRGPAPAAAWCSSRASRARSTTSPCSSATAPARSTPTWPSRPSTTRSSSASSPGRPTRPRRSYAKAVSKGIVKVISKMGISTIQSYHGAQVFEAVGPQPGLHRRVLHLDRHPGGRRRHRRGGQGGAAAPRARLPAAAPHRPPQPAGRRPVPVPPGRRAPPLQPGDRPPAPGRHPHQRLQGLQGVHRRSSTTSRRASTRCAA